MAYWLIKSEPDVFSLEDLKKVDQECWDGVRNYQARNFMRTMKVGDLCFFYHSRVKPPSIVGICEVVKEDYPDPTQFDPENRYFDPKSSQENPRWTAVDVRFVEEFREPVSLARLKEEPTILELDMYVVRKGMRLSVQPVTPEQWEAVLKLR